MTLANPPLQSAMYELADALAVNEFYQHNGWTDGLPIVPPTEERVQEYLDAGQPVISMDAKKKELLGNFYRDGKLYTQQPIEVFDHDFPGKATGLVFPHGLYDVGLNRGHINLGTSHETSEFACDSIERWWQAEGRQRYPQATRLLLFCDGGGSNSARRERLMRPWRSISVTTTRTSSPMFTTSSTLGTR